MYHKVSRKMLSLLLQTKFSANSQHFFLKILNVLDVWHFDEIGYSHVFWIYINTKIINLIITKYYLGNVFIPYLLVYLNWLWRTKSKKYHPFIFLLLHL